MPNPGEFAVEEEPVKKKKKPKKISAFYRRFKWDKVLKDS